MHHSDDAQTCQSPLRRQLLMGMAGVLGMSLLPGVWAQPAPAFKDGRLVLVFLRGAYDGLSATVPYTDVDYYKDRPTIAIPRPDGTDQTALRLDQTFALHPALAPLMPLCLPVVHLIRPGRILRRKPTGSWACRAKAMPSAAG